MIICNCLLKSLNVENSYKSQRKGLFDFSSSKRRVHSFCWFRSFKYLYSALFVTWSFYSTSSKERDMQSTSVACNFYKCSSSRMHNGKTNRNINPQFVNNLVSRMLSNVAPTVLVLHSLWKHSVITIHTEMI